MSIDLEKRAIRLHDGQTLGGFEVVGSPIEVPHPGSNTLVGGTTTTGFYGEVSQTELITFSALTTSVGLSAGTAISYIDDIVWLKFAYQGKILYIAKRPPRYNNSWDELNAAGIVYGDDPSKNVSIGNHTFKVRLMTGGDADPASVAGGEWNALFYNIVSGTHVTEQWASYTEADLNITSGTHNASYTWCQELNANSLSRAIIRGHDSITGYADGPKDNPHATRGWRPVLELIE